MQLNWLLDQLTKPQILSDGTIREPNVVMLKAADVIRQLTALFEADKAGRIKAESAEQIAEELRLEMRAKLAAVHADLIAARQADYDRIRALEYYNEVMNEDNLRSLT